MSHDLNLLAKDTICLEKGYIYLKFKKYEPLLYPTFFGIASDVLRTKRIQLIQFQQYTPSKSHCTIGKREHGKRFPD